MLLTIISTTQLLYIILDKTDMSLLENLTKQFLEISNNTTQSLNEEMFTKLFANVFS